MKSCSLKLYFYKKISMKDWWDLFLAKVRKRYSTMSSHLNLDYLVVWSPWVLVFKLTFDVYMKDPEEIKDIIVCLGEARNKR